MSIIEASVQVSSTASNLYPGVNAIDAGFSGGPLTYWQSASVNGYEWLQVQLAKLCRVGLVQVQDSPDGPWNL